MASSKETYETMEMLAESVPRPQRRILVSCWRRRVYSMASADLWRQALALLPEELRDAFRDTLPSIALFSRWERDHGYHIRSIEDVKLR